MLQWRNRHYGENTTESMKYVNRIRIVEPDPTNVSIQDRICLADPGDCRRKCGPDRCGYHKLGALFNLVLQDRG